MSSGVDWTLFSGTVEPRLKLDEPRILGRSDAKTFSAPNLAVCEADVPSMLTR